MGREDLVNDPEYAGAPNRFNHEDEINAMISAWASERTRDEAFAEMRDARIPVAPVRDIAEAMANPHLHARGMLHNMQHPYMGDVVLPSSPLRLLDYERLPVQFFPEAGADSQSVLGELLGLSEAEVAALAKDKVI